jgi:hypothetical protein
MGTNGADRVWTIVRACEALESIRRRSAWFTMVARASRTRASTFSLDTCSFRCDASDCPCGHC